MATSPKVHFRVANNEPACRVPHDPQLIMSNLTTDASYVTCGRCLRIMEKARRVLTPAFKFRGS